MLVYLLAKGASVDLRKIFQHDRYILHFSCFNGHTELVKRLLQDTEFTIFLNSEQGSSALHFAAWNGHFEIVQHLLELGLSANTNSKDNLSALHLASLNGHLTVAKILLQSGAEVDVAARFSEMFIRIQNVPEKRTL